MLLHVTDFDGDIVTSFSKNDTNLISAIYRKSQADDSEILDVEILTKKAEEFLPRRRILTKDNNGVFKEFTILTTEKENTGYSLIEASASFYTDLQGSKSIKKGSYSKMTAKSMLSEVLLGTGWSVGDVEWSGESTVSWDVENTPYEILKQICTAFNLEAEFKVEVSDTKVVKRIVDLRSKVALFNGKEIKKGKDLVSLKRTADASEINTALIALGPEDEKGNRLRIEVKDDAENQVYGLEKTYIWGVYEPESTDATMTESRLRSLAITELNKRNKINVSYEISAADIHKHYPHEVVRYGDLVRIKDPDFSPPLYAEAEVTGIETDLLSDTSQYTFGTPVEYSEKDLRKYFYEKLSSIRDMMSDNILNTNTIITEIQDTLVKTERKIHKAATPPENPEEGQLWYDTSQSKVAVLREFKDGQWQSSTAHTADQVGTLTKEQILYRDAYSSYEILRVQHAQIVNRTNEVIGNENLVDSTIKSSISSKLNDLIVTFDSVSSLIASISEETATIGSITSLYSLYSEYRTKMQTLHSLLEKANKSIQDRIKILQSQYTEQKFTDALNKVAQTIGGTYNPETGQLTANIPTQEQINKVTTDLKAYADGKDTALTDVIIKTVDAKIVDTKNEFTRQFSTLETSVNGITVGTRNLIDSKSISQNSKGTGNTIEYISDGWSAPFLSNEWIMLKLKPNTEYTMSYDVEIVSKSSLPEASWIQGGFYLYSASTTNDVVMGQLTQAQFDACKVGDVISVENTFKTPPEFVSDNVILTYCGYHKDPNTGVIEYDSMTFRNIMLVEGNKSGSFLQAPEDTLKTIDDLTVRVNTAEGGITATQEQFKSYYSKTETNTLLDSNLSPIKTDVSNAKSSITQLNTEISSKVSKSDYTADKNGIVTRLNTADSERLQLSNQISDRVTLSTYTNGIQDAKKYADTAVSNLVIGGRNILRNSDFNQGNAFWSTNGTATFEVVDGYTVAKITNLTPYGIYQSAHYPMLEEDIYTISFKAKAVGATSRFQIGLLGQPTGHSNIYDIDNIWKTYSYVFTLPVNKAANMAFHIYSTATSEQGFYITQVKLEKGNKATSFTLAPEDTDKLIADARKETTDVTKAITNYEGDIGSTFKDNLITTAEAKSLGQQKLQLDTQREDLNAKYNEVYNNSLLTGTFKTNLATAKTNYETSYTALINSINTAISDSKTTSIEYADVTAKFSDYKSKLALLTTRFEQAVDSLSTTKANNVASQYSGVINEINGKYDAVKAQSDASINSYFYNYTPTLANVPASAWTDNATKDLHVGDYFLDTATGKYYTFTKSGTTYAWTQGANTAIQQALSDASRAQGTADKKKTVFTAQPVTPYDIGDMWTQGTAGDLYVCKVARASGAFVSTDWEKATKYTDDTKANSAYALADKATQDLSKFWDSTNNIFKDGVIDSNELPRLKSHLDTLNNDKLNLTSNVTDLNSNVNLDSAMKTTLTSYNNAYVTAHTNLVNSLNTAIGDKKVTDAEITDVTAKFSSYGTALSNLNTHIQKCYSNISDNLAKTRSTEAVNNLVVGTRNLIDSASIKTTSTLVGDTKKLTHTAWSVQFLDKTWVLNKLKPNTEYTINYNVKLLTKPTIPVGSSIIGSIYLYSLATTNDVYMGQIPAAQYSTMKVGDVVSVKNTFTTPPTFADDTQVLIYSGYHKDATSGATQYANMEFTDIMLVEGNKISSYQQSPEDVTNEINQAITNFGNLESSISKTFKDGIIKESEAIALKTHLARVEQDQQDLSNIFTPLYNHPILANTVERTNVYNAKVAYNSAYSSLRDTLISYISDGKIEPAEKTTIDSLLTTYKVKVGELQNQFKICDDAIVQKTSQQAISNINVGGKNLIKLSDIPHSSNAYLVYRYELTEQWVVGQEYTISIKGNVAGGQFSIWRNTSATKVTDLTYDSKRGLWTATFICPASTMTGDNNITLSVYNTPSTQPAFSSTISQIKLEKGNVVTDWTPAPYDSDQRLTQTETYIGQDGVNITSRATKEEFNRANQTLSKAITDLVINAVDGATITHNVDGTISSANIGNTITLKSSAINLVGDVYMQDGKVRVSDMKIGGADKNGKIEIKNANDEVFFGLDTEQATASELSIGTLRVEKIENKDIVTQSSEDKVFYVTNAGDNENDGLTINTAFATVERALEEIPIVYNGECTIYLRGLDSGELAEVKGYMGKGKIKFAGCTSTGAPETNKVRSTISFKFAGNTIDCYLNNLIIETESGVHGVSVNSSSVNASNININGSNGSESAISISRNSYFEWRDGQATNVARGANCLSGSNVYLRDVNLYASDYGIVAAYASQVECSNVGIKAGTMQNAFGGSFINGSMTNLSTPTTVAVATKPTIKTVTLTNYSAGHFYKSSIGWNGTFMKGYPIQGTWNPYGERLGFWFFGSQFDRFNGKTIKKVRVYIGRSSVNMQGYTGSRKATLRMHGYTSKPSTTPATSSTTQAKAIMFTMGESKWVDVTSVFGTMLSSSSWKGFAVNTDSASAYEYMAMKPTLKVEVTYVV